MPTRLALLPRLLLPCLALTLSGAEDRAAALMKTVSELANPAMQGRLTGSPSGRKAEAWVEKAMRALPLEVKTQEFGFPLYEVLSPTAFDLLDAKGAPQRRLAYLTDFREVQYSGSGDVTGELVFAGYGVDAPGFSPYGQVDVKGKIVVLLWGLPKGAPVAQAYPDVKLHAAWTHGAKGVVLVPTGGLAKRVEELGDEAVVRALGPTQAFNPELYHAELPAVFLRKDAVEALLGAPVEALTKDPSPKALGRRAHLLLKARVNREAKSRNVFGILRGQDPQLGKEVVLLGAHYDHLGMGADGRIFPGASDNASGTAVVLEAARALATSGQRPKRTVVFALWGAEEQGLYGSRFYAEKAPLLPLEDTKLMIQLDDVGGKEVALSNVNDNPLVQAFAGKAIREGRLTPVDWGGQGASDDVPFLAKKIPAYRFVAPGAHHHRATDTPAIVDREGLAKVADIVIEGLKTVTF